MLKITFVKMIVVLVLLTFSLAANAEEKVFCNLCLKEITGAYVRFEDGAVYCNKCMGGGRCAQCAKPAKDKLEGVLLCKKCLQNPKRCGACEKIIIGHRAFCYPLSDKIYCSDCVESKKKCRFCSAPTDSVAPYGVRWPMCDECQSKMVIGVDETVNILNEVVRIIGNNLLLRMSKGVGLEVCDNITHAGRRMNGSEMGLMRTVGSEYVILIQDGMPLKIVYKTLAHEWAHAWIAENGSHKHKGKMEEGFCQWVASKVLIEKGFDASLDILRNRPDMYGAGYRKIEKIEMARGRIGVLEYMQSSPPGLFKRLFVKK